MQLPSCMTQTIMFSMPQGDPPRSVQTAACRRRSATCMLMQLRCCITHMIMQCDPPRSAQTAACRRRRTPAVRCGGELDRAGVVSKECGSAPRRPRTAGAPHAYQPRTQPAENGPQLRTDHDPDVTTAPKAAPRTRTARVPHAYRTMITSVTNWPGCAPSCSSTSPAPSLDRPALCW